MSKSTIMLPFSPEDVRNGKQCAMEDNARAVHKAAGILAAAGAIVMYGRGRLERRQISAKTMREIELAADQLRTLAVATSNTDN